MFVDEKLTLDEIIRIATAHARAEGHAEGLLAGLTAAQSGDDSTALRQLAESSRPHNAQVLAALRDKLRVDGQLA